MAIKNVISEIGFDASVIAWTVVVGGIGNFSSGGGGGGDLLLTFHAVTGGI